MNFFILLLFSLFINAQELPPKAKDLDDKGFLFPPICSCEGCRQTSKFGLRKPPTFGASSNHKGCDIAAPLGTEVFASADGEVHEVTKGLKKSRSAKGYGNQVMIKHLAPNKSIFFTRYGHLYTVEPGIEKGVKIKKGQKIGTVDSTGKSTGNHLHFEITKCNGDAGEKDNCIVVDPQDYTVTDKPSANCAELREQYKAPAEIER